MTRSIIVSELVENHQSDVANNFFASKFNAKHGFTVPRKYACAASNVEPSCKVGSMKYYALCELGGALSCGITHTGLVMLDVAKCKIQVNPQKYKNTTTALRLIVAEDGAKGLIRGWQPTFIGYSLQGMFKFGLYEVFKNLYSDLAGEENAYLHRTSLYLAASASAEFFADIAYAPMEAVKVRMQTQQGFPGTLRGTVPRMYASEGLYAFYKGLGPLWARQIPYTMIKFSCFERTIETLYKNVVPKPRSECSTIEQLAVTFTAGYIAGVLCAIVSHPPDSVVSVLNKDVGSSPLDALRKLGFRGIWAGLPTRIYMVGALTSLQWLIYDAVKVSFRLPRPPPPEMPESLREKLRNSQ